uniref:Uncharacterized protein n=1 Tax=Magallana gigas TaxID=29159 RepID=K1QZF9_MAGGI
MSSDNVMQLAKRLDHSEIYFKKACLQIVMLNDKLSSASRRYRMPHTSGRRSFRYSLRLRLAAIEGLRNVYYEYAMIKAQEMQQVRRDSEEEEEEGHVMPKPQRNLTCTQCWDTGHTRNFCKTEPRCKVCKTPGHKLGDSRCSSYQIQESVIAFNGENNILSNFYPCELNIFGVQHKSAEHAFQYAKSLRCGDLEAAKSIQEAKDALSAKRIGDKVRINEQWTESCENVMSEIIENKCVQVERFREKLRSVKKNTLFAESTFNDKWGTGLDKAGTENTKASDWPGQNLLGHIIGKVAQKIRKRKKSDQWSQPKQSSRQQKKHSTTQKNIAEMLRSLRANTDAESGSGCDASSETDSEPEESGKG